MGTIDLSTEALLLSTMVSYVIAACLLPLALGGMMHKDMMGMQGMKSMGQYGVQMEGMMQVGNMGKQMMGHQMMGNQMMGNQMMGMNGGNWWGMTSEEKKREAMHEKMMKEHKMKRENMVAQWRMWQNQL